MRFFFLPLGLSLLIPSAYAWREAGHFAVCEIAYRHLDSTAKKEVDRLMGVGKFPAECTWPDKVRKSSTFKASFAWHFFDAPAEIELAQEFGPRGNLVQALFFSEETLRDSASSDERKAIFLKFLGHFTGDVHQPYHVGDPEDRGGNLTEVGIQGSDGSVITHFHYHEELIDEVSSKVRPISLHKFWDMHLLDWFSASQQFYLEESSPYHYVAYANQLELLPPTEKIRQHWDNTNYLDWANETRQLRGTIEDRLGRGPVLGPDYHLSAVLIANQRIKKAGYRLAGILNRIFGDVSLAGDPRAERYEELRAQINQDESKQIHVPF